MIMRWILKLFIISYVLRDVLGNTLMTASVMKPFAASDMLWVDNQGMFLQSSSGNYVLNFHNPNSGNRFYLCITFNSPPNSPVVWTANRDVGVGKEDQMVFQDDGNVVLFGSRGLPVWQTRTNGTDAKFLQLQDTGNLVVLDSQNNTLWESFKYPTDTLLLGQNLTTSMQLVSSKSSTDFAPGIFSLQLSSTTLQLLVDLGGSQLPYWTLSSDVNVVKGVTGPAPEYAVVDSTGSLNVYGNRSVVILQYVFQGYANATGILVLGVDGNLNFEAFIPGRPVLSKAVISSDCHLPLRCGSYGVCASGGQCTCPRLLPPVNSLDSSQGCKVAPLDVCKSPQDVQFEDLDSGLSYFGVDYGTSVAADSLDACKQLCRNNCSCAAGFFSAASQSCFLSETKVGSFRNEQNGKPLQTFIKVGDRPGGGGQKVSIYLIIGSTVAFILCSLAVFGWWYRRRVAAATGDSDEEDGFLDSIPGLPTRFTYKQLQAATNGFSKKLGGGGFGSVYEGVLSDKSKVAVKQLESIGQGKKEFRAEVATIGSIHHVNLVRLRGFCSEGTHRLLVYEFLARGSLDKSLFVESSLKLVTVDAPLVPVLDWDTRYNIALGTARGLAYLHEDCRERIIHCDIKPENILLDESFTAKVSDFGLAKLMNREQSHVFTTMRGTRGYLAPEWLLNTAISEKSDVYSFGMVLLEIVSGRKNFDPTETSEKWYIPAYAFKQAEVGSLTELLDSRLKGFANEEQVVKAVKIALWCIQEEMHLRPSTGKVVQMLEGNVPVLDPPLSTQLAVRLHARLADAVSERDNYSIGASEFNSQDLLSASYLSGPR